MLATQATSNSPGSGPRIPLGAHGGEDEAQRVQWHREKRELADGKEEDEKQAKKRKVSCFLNRPRCVELGGGPSWRGLVPSSGNLNIYYTAAWYIGMFRLILNMSHPRFGL